MTSINDELEALDPEVEAQLAQVSHQLHDHQGEFVLMVQRTLTETSGPGGCFAPDTYYGRLVIRTLGVIAPITADFVLDAASQELPTERYYMEGRLGRAEEVTQGTWPYRHLFQSRHGLNHGFPMPIAHGLTEVIDWRYVAGTRNHYEDERGLEIIVGDKAVAAWFTWRDGKIDHIIWPEKAPLWLQAAAQALGRPLAEAPELEAKRDREREQVLEDLWELNDEAAAYRRELAALRRARNGSGVYSRGGAVGLVTDDDDLRVVSFRPSGKLKELIDRIRRKLQQAEELGLTDHPYVKAFALRYGVEAPVGA